MPSFNDDKKRYDDKNVMMEKRTNLKGIWCNRIRCRIEIVRRFLDEINDFVRIPGLNHILNYNNHLLERLLWIIILFAGYLAVYQTCRYQWNRYLANPTVMNMDRDYHGTWNGTLPAVTMCDTIKYDYFKVRAFILSEWDLDETDSDFDYYFQFIVDITNITIGNLNDMLLKYEDDERLQDLQLTNITKYVMPSAMPKVYTFKNSINLDMHLMATEMGFCWVANAGPIIHFLNRDIQYLVPVSCNFTINRCVLRIEARDITFGITIHSPYEIPTYESLTTSTTVMSNSIEYIGSYKITETVASESLKYLTFNQRKCMFYDDWFLENSEFSGNLCLLKCRATAALEICQCIPYFYSFMDGPERTLAGYICLRKYSWPYITTKSCECPKTCTELTYLENNYHIQHWIGENILFSKISRYRLEIVPSRMRYRRDILFSFEDFIVSFGGVVTLFVGISIWHCSRLFYMLYIKGFYMVDRIYQSNFLSKRNNK